jgi:hypothetical protein
VQQRLEDPGRRVGQVDEDPRAPGAEVLEEQAGVGAGLPFLLLEPPALLVLGDLGSDDVEDAAAQDAEPARVEVLGLGHEPGLGLRPELGTDPRRELVERGHDHPRLREVDLPGQHPGSDPGVPGLQRCGQLGVAGRRSRIDPGLVSDPRPDRPGTGLDSDVPRVRHHRQPQALHPGGDPREG